MAAKMMTEKDIDLINRKMANADNYKRLNLMFTQQRGHRWVNRLQTFAKWLWENREAILQILGLVIMFAEDGTPTVKDVKDFENDGEKLREIKQNLSKRKPTKLTPHGEKVEDFVDPVAEAKRMEAMETLTSEAQEAGLYDIGLDENPLVKDSDEAPKPKRKRSKKSGDKDEVQSGENGGEATDRLKSDDLQ